MNSKLNSILNQLSLNRVTISLAIVFRTAPIIFLILIKDIEQITLFLSADTWENQLVLLICKGYVLIVVKRILNIRFNFISADGVIVFYLIYMLLDTLVFFLIPSFWHSSEIYSTIYFLILGIILFFFGFIITNHLKSRLYGLKRIYSTGLIGLGSTLLLYNFFKEEISAIILIGFTGIFFLMYFISEILILFKTLFDKKTYSILPENPF